MPHIAPLPWEANPQFLERFEHYQNTRGFVPNSILTMQRRPAIAAAFMDLNKAVLYEGTVPEELKMLVSLVHAQASGCRYCQAHMTNLASIYQASDEKFALSGTSKRARFSPQPSELHCAWAITLHWFPTRQRPLTSMRSRSISTTDKSSSSLRPSPCSDTSIVGMTR